MVKRGKKYNAIIDQVDKGVLLSIDQALDCIKKFSYARFDESVDINVAIGIDSSKGEQAVRSSAFLPHGTGKVVRVVVFAKDDYAKKAKKVGADWVGQEDLVKKISDGWMEFDYAVATPDIMGLVGKIAKILGPRNLLPNKKLGTVTFDVETIVSELKKGRVFFKNDKYGIVHCSIGKVSFGVKQLRQNICAFLKSLLAAKPATAKGRYIKKVSMSSTMGLGMKINADELLRFCN